MSTSNGNVASSSSSSSSLLKFVGGELDKVEKSFEVARRAMEQVFVQINEARGKLNNLLIIQDQQQLQSENHLRCSLEELRAEVRYLESSIPFSLLRVQEEGKKPPPQSESNFFNPPPIWSILLSPPGHDLEHPPPPALHSDPSISFLDDYRFQTFYRDLHSFNFPIAFFFLLAFRENTFIKRGLLHRFLGIYLSMEEIEWTLEKCNAATIIELRRKHGNNSVAGYWVNPLARTFLDETVAELRGGIFITGNIDNGEIIYSDDPTKSLKSTYPTKSLESTYCAEIDDLHLSFTCVSRAGDLRYLSLRGNSTMKDFPECITKYDTLGTLDLGDCQNLEVITSKIANLGCLTYLDMSGCYSLMNMPPALAQLHMLRVLKGFVISQINNNNIINKDACTLMDLARGLTELEKLKISTYVEGFPNGGDWATLQDFKKLSNLNISWEGYSTTTITSSQGGDIIIDNNDRRFDFKKLKKLDLQCVPSGITDSWLKPYNFPALRKLYIRGGQLDDIRGSSHYQDVERDLEWSVQSLRLKYLNYKLKIDWDEVYPFFPRLQFLQIVDCPNITYKIRFD